MSNPDYAAQQVTIHKETLEHHQFTLHLLLAREHLHTTLLQALIATMPPTETLKKNYLDRLIDARERAKQIHHPWNKEQVLQIMDIEHLFWIEHLNECGHSAASTPTSPPPVPPHAG